ncbi:MAG: HAMP domain-containing protein [Methylomonas sp.]|nr:HAMP domain-containing protein [Methylomonas sp.]PPD20064.1 MAG: PAS domain-containing sensor histidine kinase [Methylomonas sp.]PPD25995.1 MAG: PAS domain-containing sensor histidine kinase [Methylomonas sp.]PPD37724.1 MAG: PAS domain-containing sensor histidine kinase [Methylomonas sp.]PPD39596.1 MAG: PAS domain-containing sensor histidine kinase [Methylomonas sp.]
MASGKLKLPASVSILALFGFVLLSLQLMSTATQESSALSELYSWLLVINTLGSIILLALVAFNAYSLVRELRKKEAGSRLTLRMISLFVLLALAPAATVFYFSVQFLHRGIDSWFNVEIDRAMDDALELSQSALAQRMNWHIKQTRQIAERLEGKSETLMALELGAITIETGAIEAAVFSGRGHILASSSINPADILPNLPDEQVWLQLKQNKQYFAFDPGEDDEMLVRVILPIERNQNRFLQMFYPIPARMTDLADSIEFAFIRYQEMTFLRNSLKTSFSLLLLLVLLLSLFAAIWIAFISIRAIVAPVRELVKGTQAVAEGDYRRQLPVMTQDDLGFLVESFNQMTRRIARASEETRAAGLEVENQRAYLETILANLTAGVISFDADCRIRTANQAAYRILRIPVSHFVGENLASLAHTHGELDDVLTAIQRLLEQADDIWEQRIVFLGNNGRQELLCRGTPLFSQHGERTGAVVVFDDVTDLIQAQKNAAWGEVARRLAHEIKNPLTPIQLSAERLQHKLSKELPESSQEFLAKATRTIVQQVEAMKRMVDDFSEYARPSKRQVEKLNLIDLIQQVTALYPPSDVNFRFNVASHHVIVEADPVSIRQVLHNLIKNAQEASVGQPCCIDIKVAKAVRNNNDYNNADYVEFSVYDNGSGLNGEQIETIFEPYVTSKAKGTGLGLAIVKKIVEEHGGAIWADTSYNAGAGFVIQLPVFEFGTDE